MTRDFIGYGAEPPHAGWPGDARIAVNFVINFEEGSELSYPAGDGVSEGGLTEMIGSDLAVKGRDLGAESMFEYGARVGFWRLHRIFTRFQVPVTIFGCARAFEANPPAAAAIAASDWDICSHGYRWTNHPGLPEDEERRQIAAAVDLIRKTTGKTPVGWYCRYAPSENTRRLIVEHGGFLYDSDTYNDELPYWVRVGDKPHLVVPYSLTTNDSKFGRGVFGSGEDFFAFLRDSFDILYEEGAERPRMMSIGLHMRLTGHPGRAKALIRFIEYLRSHDRVWICRREDIARHWIARFPPRDLGLVRCHPWASGGEISFDRAGKTAGEQLLIARLTQPAFLGGVRQAAKFDQGRGDVRRCQHREIGRSLRIFQQHHFMSERRHQVASKCDR